jgi:transposase-like protein
LEVARRRGVRLGTPPKLTEDHRRLAAALFEQGETITEIAKQCGVTVTGLRGRINQWRNEGQFPAARPRKRKAEPAARENHERGMVH